MALLSDAHERELLARLPAVLDADVSYVVLPSGDVHGAHYGASVGGLDEYLPWLFPEDSDTSRTAMP